MSKQPLRPQGDFPAVGLGRRLAAMFYDFLLCTALLIVTTFIYKLIMMSFIGEAKMRELSEAGALDGDPLLSTILFFVLFGFFAKFWTHSGQTLGMQVWVPRVCPEWVQNLAKKPNSTKNRMVDNSGSPSSAPASDSSRILASPIKLIMISL